MRQGPNTSNAVIRKFVLRRGVGFRVVNNSRGVVTLSAELTVVQPSRMLLQ